MPIVECSNGHYYDNNKFDKCPICGESFKSIDIKNKYVFSSDDNNQFSEALTERYVEEKSTEEELTVAINIKNNKSILTTGWLMCIHGESLGRSFPIKTDRNFIGRDYDMDIVIPDKSVTRTNHCSIIYDSKNYEFYFVHGNSPVMINGDFIETSIKLKENDKLSIGDSDYIFVPYCNKERNWND